MTITYRDDSPSKPSGLTSILSIEAKERLQRAETLINVTHMLAATQSLDEVLETLVEIAVKATNSERGSLFLYDSQAKELYSRVAQGEHTREIRFLGTEGIAGHVFNTGTGLIIDRPYSDDRFNRSIDGQTGFITRNIISAPIKFGNGEIIGVVECLNSNSGGFTADDLDLLEAICTQAATALRDSQLVHKMRLLRKQELEFLDIVTDITSEIDLGAVLQKVMSEARRLLNAERSSLFLNNTKTDELWSQVGEGLGATEIRLPNSAGIAGHVFTTGEIVNIPHAYADLRFNPAFDQKTGFFTRSILCVPIINKHGRTIGVTQVLNKIGGPFTAEDESRLKAFSAQVSIALENAKLFNDVQDMKNYNESMLQSMSNGVITLDEDGRIKTCNNAGLRIIQKRREDILHQPVETVFGGSNSWILERLERIAQVNAPDSTMDAELQFKGKTFSVNVTVLPLISVEKTPIGNMIVIEDFTSEKRVKSAMSRYMDPLVTDQLLESGEEILGGKSTLATILFTDIRGFAALSEELGPQGTVRLLNEYFTIMVECLQRKGGMLDKLIGDAMMAAFGIPFPNGDDEDRAVRSAISMIRALADWNRMRRQNALRPIEMGIGVNTDVIVSGNIGSPKRMDYTMIGDGVNLASRLESACKQYRARILISENTLKRLNGVYFIRDVDRVVVQGKSEPVGIYEVLDYHTEDSYPNMSRALACHGAAIKLYREANFSDAINAFEQVLAHNPNDGLATIYIERCRHLMHSHPGDDWNGVWFLNEK